MRPFPAAFPESSHSSHTQAERLQGSAVRIRRTSWTVTDSYRAAASTCPATSVSFFSSWALLPGRLAPLTMRRSRLAHGLVLLSLAGVVQGQSVLQIDGGTTLGVGGGSSIFVTGTDIGDPFNAPVVLIGNNPNPLMTLCSVQSFTSTATRIHCVVDSTRLPALPAAQWGVSYAKQLSLHVLVGGRAAICDNGANIGGTGIGDCRLTFDVGGTPLVESIHTPVISAAGAVLRLQARSREPYLGAIANSSDGDASIVAGATNVTTVAIRLRRGTSFAGCILLDEDAPYPMPLFHPLGPPLTPDTHHVGCRVRAEAHDAAGFWDAVEMTDTTLANRGTAVVALGAKRVDLATNTLYEVETTPRISSVVPATIPPSGGVALTIHGAGFGGRPCDLQIEAAGVMCAPIRASRDDGSVTCLMAAMDNESTADSTAFVGDRGVDWEWWEHGASSQADLSPLSALRNLPAFPASADGTTLLADFTMPSGGCWSAQCAGGRLSGWLTPSVSGTFSFVLRADAEAELWWSTNRSALATVPLANASANGVATAWQQGSVGPNDSHVSPPQQLVAGERYWLELLCAPGASECAVGMRAHVSALPEALSFGMRHLTPRSEVSACSALTSDQCCGAFEASGGPCAPLSPAATATCVSSEWLQANPQDASTMMPCPYAVASQPNSATSAFNATWTAREQLPANQACSAVTDRARCAFARAHLDASRCTRCFSSDELVMCLCVYALRRLFGRGRARWTVRPEPLHRSCRSLPYGQRMRACELGALV